ncbi:MAG: mechanosensitive ion channel [Gammaproteobacteria bacterium]|nr:MAG: mechanosensitive ion channel [Gammaproteobacteria bacterium]
MKWLNDWLQLKLLEIGDYVLTLGELFGFLLILAVTLVLSRWLSRALTKVVGSRSHISPSQLYTFTRLMSYSILVIGFLMALASLGVSFDRMLLVAGALGVGIGFGLQNIANNFVSGIIILFEKSLRVGDFVELESGLLGEVKEINIRSTLLKTMDNADILVPNSEFINGRVNNWTLKDDERRFSIPFGVAYGSDTDKVIEIVTGAAKELPLTYEKGDRQTFVVMKEFGDSSLDFALSVWVRGEAIKRPGLVKSEYLLAINKALVSNGIEIPFPQRDLHLRSSSIPRDRVAPDEELDT